MRMGGRGQVGGEGRTYARATGGQGRHKRTSARGQAQRQCQAMAPADHGWLLGGGWGLPYDVVVGGRVGVCER